MRDFKTRVNTFNYGAKVILMRLLDTHQFKATVVFDTDLKALFSDIVFLFSLFYYLIVLFDFVENRNLSYR